MPETRRITHLPSYTIKAKHDCVLRLVNGGKLNKNTQQQSKVKRSKERKMSAAYKHNSAVDGSCIFLLIFSWGWFQACQGD